MNNQHLTAETPEETMSEPYQDNPEDIIELVTRHTQESSTVHGLVIGKVKGFTESNLPMVNFPMNPTGQPMACRSTVELKPSHIGREVALMFEMNDVRKPIVIGLMHVYETTVEIEKDGETQVISAEKEMVLRCGKASIQLRADGQVIIKGQEILSRAKRTHTIQGGMVYIN